LGLGFLTATSLSRNCLSRTSVQCRDHGSNEQGMRTLLRPPPMRLLPRHCPGLAGPWREANEGGGQSTIWSVNPASKGWVDFCGSVPATVPANAAYLSSTQQRCPSTSLGLGLPTPFADQPLLSKAASRRPIK